MPSTQKHPNVPVDVRYVGQYRQYDHSTSLLAPCTNAHTLTIKQIDHVKGKTCSASIMQPLLYAERWVCWRRIVHVLQMNGKEYIFNLFR